MRNPFVLKILPVIFTLTGVFLLHSLSFADVPKEQRTEVEQLLSFVINSPCTFNRNGTKHPGKESFEHIKKKYDYYRDDIKNTEDFIQYSATKSMMSGKYYTVNCPGKKTIKSKDWLLNELKLIRIKYLKIQ